MRRSLSPLLAALIVALLVAVATPAYAAVTITVDRTDDPSPPAAACTAAGNDCSFRGAVAFANTNADTTINVPAGTYSLSIAGTGESLTGDNSIGDLDVFASGTTIAGAGSGVTTINQTTPASGGTDRVLEVNPLGNNSFAFAIQGVTLTGGSTGEAGGGMAVGGPGGSTTVNDARFLQNHAVGTSPNGGAIANLGGGTLTVNRTVFDQNDAQGDGGAIYMDTAAGGRLLVDSSTFSQNLANGTNSNGGAVYVAGSGNGASSITRTAFVSNGVGTPAGKGGGLAVASNGGSLSLQYDRLVGGLAPAGNGLAVRNSNLAATGTSVPVDDDWWGVNSGPPAGALSQVFATRWLQLRHTANPSSILINTSSALTADLLGRNSGGPITGTNLAGLPLPAAQFSNAQLGTVAASAVPFSNGAAGNTFTAGATAGDGGGADVTLDGQTVKATVNVQAPALFTYPLNGATNVDTTKPFTWTPIANAQNYRLNIGTNRGGFDVFAGPLLPGSQTSYAVPPVLPTSSTMWARIQTKGSDGVFRVNDVQFTTAAHRQAVFTYPLNGATNVDTTKPFTWGGASDVQSYRLKVGTTQGGSDLFQSALLPASQTSYTVPPVLPINTTIWARIETRGSDTVFRSNDVQFTTGPHRQAAFTYPLTGATNVDTTKPFTWAGASDAVSYRLSVGTTQGGSDLFISSLLPGTQTSYAVPPVLPTSTTMWARIETRGTDGVFRSNDVQFTTAAHRQAVFTYPLNGATSVDTTKPFTWGGASDALNYRLNIGTTMGGFDLYAGPLLPATQTSATAPPLPTSATLWARIQTKGSDGVFRVNDVQFTTAAHRQAVFTNPLNGATNVDTTLPFTWTGASDALNYRVNIGTTMGGFDLYAGGLLPASQTSLVPPILPNSATLWARIFTKGSDGVFRFNDVQFTTAAHRQATFTSPVDGATNVMTPRTFTWAGASPTPQNYILYVGTSQGAGDLLTSPVLPATQTSYDVPSLPPASTLWARIRTKGADGVVRVQDISFTTAP
jgi:predicted outer membrane repeat protein